MITREIMICIFDTILASREDLQGLGITLLPPSETETRLICKLMATDEFSFDIAENKSGMNKGSYYIRPYPTFSRISELSQQLLEEWFFEVNSQVLIHHKLFNQLLRD